YLVISPFRVNGQPLLKMTNMSADDDFGVSVYDILPVCQWSFSHAREFHHVSGDSHAIFHHSPTDLSRRHVSLIDDSSGTWSARLEDMFRGQISTARTAAGDYVLFPVAVHASGSSVSYVAGFAFPAGATEPTDRDLELAAAVMLEAVNWERTRSTRFLHDV